MPVNRRAVLAALSGIVVAAGLVVAQSNRITQGQVYTAVTADEVGKVLDGLGYAASIGKDSEGDPQIQFKVGSAPIYVDFYGCKAGVCTSTLLYYGIDLDKGTTLDKVNAWNADNRFNRGYLDEDKDPVLESDLDFAGGTTLNAVREWIRTFVRATTDFRKAF
jgi:hypothetical protein